MKKIILSLSAAVLCLSLQAQQAEMDATQAAYKAKNYTKALQAAEKADQMLKSNRTVEPADIAEFYMAAAQSAKSSGDMILAAKYLSKLGQLETQPFFKAKNKDTKDWEYFYDQSEANKVTAAGNYTKVRSEQLDTNHMSEMAPQLNKEGNDALKLANESFQAKKYEVAGNEFLKAYYLYAAVGNANDLLKYYAGISKLQTEDKREAAELLQNLVDKGFDGVQTNYYAIDKESGKKVSFSSKEDMDTQVKLGLASKPEVEKTESLEEELLSNTTYAWYVLEEWENALAVGKNGLKKFPKNENMNQLVSGVYYKSGNVDEFVKDLKVKAENGNATAVDLFNLAKSIEDGEGDIEEAKKYYQMSIEKDPKYTDSYLNLALAIIKDEKDYVELMNNNLGTSSKEKKVYAENKKKRQQLYKDALPYLEKAYELNPDDLNLIKVLRNTYEVVNNDEKFFEFKKKFEEKVGKQ